MTQATASRSIAAGLSLECLSVGRAVGEARLLSGVSFEARPGQLVGLLGPSGAGKSTLIRLLTGYDLPSTGQVLLGGRSLADDFDGLRTRIGYVPQEAIVHQGLTVRRSLEFAARLRLPADLGPAGRRRRVTEVLEEVGLADRAELTVGRLSGGQLKRVSIALELLNEPALLVLDEPTAGLDPATADQMMTLFRRLADAGRTVLLSTHRMPAVDWMDHLIVLVDGRLAWAGTPGGALDHFSCRRHAELFAVLATASGADWAARLRARRGAGDGPVVAARGPVAEARPIEGQLRPLVERTLSLLVADRRNLALLLLQAPLIGLFIAVAHDGGTARGALEILLNATLASIWFGAINSCREIVKERPIYLRERKVNLRVGPYYLAKFAVLSGLCLVQSILLLATIVAFDRLPGSNLERLAALFLTSQAGLALGLAISAVVDTADRAVSMVPIVLIPQAILVGIGREFTGLARLLEVLTFSRWGFAAQRGLTGGGPVAADLAVLAAMTTFLAVATCVWLRLKDEL